MVRRKVNLNLQT